MAQRWYPMNAYRLDDLQNKTPLPAWWRGRPGGYSPLQLRTIRLNQAKGRQ